MHFSVLAVAGVALMPLTRAIPFLQPRAEPAQKPANKHPSAVDHSDLTYASLLSRSHSATTEDDDEDCPNMESSLTVEDFHKSEINSLPAIKADTPAGYVKKFINLQAFYGPNDDNILASTLATTYDPGLCARNCSESDRCQAFSLAFMRLPSLELEDEDCENPPARPYPFCTYLSQAVETEPTTRVLTVRDFDIVGAGTNVYNKDVAKTLARTEPSRLVERDEALDDAKCKNDPKIINGGFEMDNPSRKTTPTGWRISEVAPTVAFGLTRPGSSNNGETYAFVANLLPNDISKAMNGFMLSQQLNTCPGQEYSVSFDYRFDNAADGKCSISIGLGDGTDPKKMKTRVFVSGDNEGYHPHLWYTPSTAFKATTSHDMLAFFVSCDEGKWNNYSIDNVVVEPKK